MKSKKELTPRDSKKNMKVIEANKYNKRQELEDFVRINFGNDIKENRDADLKIKGTRAQLARLQLDDRTTVWGIKCVITDVPTDKLNEDREKTKDPLLQGEVPNRRKE